MRYFLLVNIHFSQDPYLFGTSVSYKIGCSLKAVLYSGNTLATVEYEEWIT